MRKNGNVGHKTILVTGGAGYIGSHVVSTLLDQEYSVIVVDDFSSSSESVLRSIAKICKCDLVEIDLNNADKIFTKLGKSRNFFLYAKAKCSDVNLVEKIFGSADIFGVIHLAGLKSVYDSVIEPLHYYSENIFEAISLLTQMKRYKCKNLIFSSSASVYGSITKSPVSEDDDIAPLSPYAKTKHIIEQICSDLAASDPNWRIVALRYFNPVGAHDSNLIGENFESNPPNLMPVLMAEALSNSPSIRIFGSDYDTKDGTAIRDYIHIMDLAEGHVCAVDNNEFGFEVFNLGTGTGYSVKELVNSFSKATGVKFEIQYQERREGDIASSIASVEKARSKLGWTAQRDIESMCRSAYMWAKHKH